MKIVMNMKRQIFKKGDIIFDINDVSDDLFLINSGEIHIKSKKGMTLATLCEGELFGEMAAIRGSGARTAQAIAATHATIDIIDSKVMRKKLTEADPLLRALVRNLTPRLTDSNELNEKQWMQLSIYKSLSPDEIEKP